MSNQRGNAPGSKLDCLAQRNRAPQEGGPGHWQPFCLPGSLNGGRGFATCGHALCPMPHASGSSILLATNSGEPHGAGAPPQLPLHPLLCKRTHACRAPRALALDPHAEIPPQKLALPLATSSLSKPP